MTAVANLFTPKVASMLWPCACGTCAVNVAWRWCEQVAGSAVSAALGARRALWRCDHLSPASRGAETVAHGSPRRFPAMAAIGVDTGKCRVGLRICTGAQGGLPSSSHSVEMFIGVSGRGPRRLMGSVGAFLTYPEPHRTHPGAGDMDVLPTRSHAYRCHEKKKFR